MLWYRPKEDVLERFLESQQFIDLKELSLADVDYVDVGEFTVAIDPSSGAWVAEQKHDGFGKNFLKREFSETEQAFLFRRNILKERNGEQFYPNTIDTPDGRNLRRNYLAIVETTSRCNLGCTYCFKSATPIGTDMSLETAAATVRYLLEIEAPSLTVEFAGGEPLLNLDIIEAVCAGMTAGRDHVHFTIQTNATRINSRFLELAEKYGIKVSASLEGSAYYLNKVRPFAGGRPSSTSIMSGVKQLATNGLLTGIVSVFNAETPSDPEEFLDMLQEVSVTRFKCNMVVMVGRGNDNRNKLLASNRAYATYMRDVVSKGLQLKPQILENNTFHMTQRILRRIPTYRCSNSPCDAGLTFFSIRPNGDMWPCDRYTSRSDMRLGNVAEMRTPTDMVADNEMTTNLNKRNVFKAGTICSTCPIRSLCGGGCGMESYDLHGNFDQPSAQCEFYKIHIPWVLENILSSKKFRRAYGGEVVKVKSGEDQ